MLHSVNELRYFLVLALGYYQCSAPAVVSKHYIQSCPVQPNQYALSFDGDDFYYYHSAYIYKLNLPSGKKDSVPFLMEHAGGLNLIQTSQGVSMLVFDKRSQYNTTLKKKVFLYNFNADLKAVDTLIFSTIPQSHLLEEDFKFVSAYIDRPGNKIYLQEEFGRLYTIERNNWSFSPIEGATVDIASGRIYTLQQQNRDSGTEYFLVSGEESIPIEHRFCGLRQFSVIQHRVIYYYSGKTYFLDDRTQAVDSIDSGPINPCRSMKNGVYAVVNGCLTVIIL